MYRLMCSVQDLHLFEISSITQKAIPDNLACLFETHSCLLLLTALLIFRVLIKEDGLLC
jgi:hypothetical protein